MNVSLEYIIEYNYIYNYHTRFLRVYYFIYTTRYNEREVTIRNSYMYITHACEVLRVRAPSRAPVVGSYTRDIRWAQRSQSW